MTTRKHFINVHVMMCIVGLSGGFQVSQYFSEERVKKDSELDRCSGCNNAGIVLHSASKEGAKPLCLYSNLCLKSQDVGNDQRIR